MASRWFEKDILSLVKRLVILEGSVALTGTTGAVGSVSGNGISSVVADALIDGKYVITLEDSYHKFMGVNFTVECADAAGSGLATVEVVSEDINGATPTITIQCFGLAAGALAVAFPSEDCTIHFNMLARNSSITGKGE